jgi:hypothetical protein
MDDSAKIRHAIIIFSVGLSRRILALQGKRQRAAIQAFAKQARSAASTIEIMRAPIWTEPGFHAVPGLVFQLGNHHPWNFF